MMKLTKKIKITGLLAKVGAKITWNDKDAVANILILSTATCLAQQDVKAGLKVMGVTTAAYTAFNAGRAHMLALDLMRLAEEAKSEG